MRLVVRHDLGRVDAGALVRIAKVLAFQGLVVNVLGQSAEQDIRHAIRRSDVGPGERILRQRRQQSLRRFVIL